MHRSWVDPLVRALYGILTSDHIMSRPPGHATDCFVIFDVCSTSVVNGKRLGMAGWKEGI